MITRPLPDCPHCDNARTLEAIRGEGYGVIVAECQCCSAVVRVSPEGIVIHGVRRDAQGYLIDGP